MPDLKRSKTNRDLEENEVLLAGELSRQDARKFLIRDARHHVARFADFAILDGDASSLSPAEYQAFASLLGAPIGDSLRAFEFVVTDANNDGLLGIAEFFAWSLSHAYAKYGAKALDSTFSRYDTDDSGSLDSFELDKVCTEMGFGAASLEIFESLDKDGNNAVSYREIVEALRTREALQKWDFSQAPPQPGVVDTTNWVIESSSDPEAVLAELLQLLRDSGANVCELVKIFDQDAGTELQIDAMEFYDGMRTKFGYKGPKHVIEAIFNILDSDRGGKIGFDEFFEAVRSQRHALDKRFKSMLSMKFVLPDAMRKARLDEIAWDVETVRILMQQMMERCQLNTNVLMKAWDKNGERSLDRIEFASHVRLCFSINDDDEWADDLWEVDLEPVLREAYSEIKALSTHVSGRVDAEALESWLAPPPGRPDDDTIILKSSRMIRQRDKRRGLLPETPLARARVDLRARTKAGISAAAASSNARGPKLEGLVPRWRRSHAGLPPLQRWEEDALVTSVRTRAIPSARRVENVPRVLGSEASQLGADAAAVDRLLCQMQQQSDESSPRARPSPRVRRHGHAKPFPSPSRSRTRVEDALGASHSKFKMLETQLAELCAIREAEGRLEHVPRASEQEKQILRAQASKLCHEYNKLAMEECLRRDALWAVELLQRALSAAPKSDTNATLLTLSNLGVCWMQLGSPSTAVRYLCQAKDLGDEAEMLIPGSPRGSSRRRGLVPLMRLRVRILLNLCAVHNQLGKHAKALDYAEVAVMLVAPAPSVTSLSVDHGCELKSPRLPPINGGGNVESSASLAGSVVAMSNEERETHRAMALHNCCVCYEHLGRLSSAREAAQEALGAARAVLPPGEPLLRRLDEVARSLSGDA